jgi:hypothetical protein
MRLSNKQKAMLHQVPAALGVSDEQRRIVQFNVGGFRSAADFVTREGFIAVLAFYERRAGGQLPGYSRGYWLAEDARANPTDAQVLLARRLAGQIGWTSDNLDSFVRGKKMTCGAYDGLEQLPGWWLNKVIEALKAIGKRQGVV